MKAKQGAATPTTQKAGKAPEPSVLTPRIQQSVDILKQAEQVAPTNPDVVAYKGLVDSLQQATTPAQQREILANIDRMGIEDRVGAVLNPPATEIEVQPDAAISSQAAQAMTSSNSVVAGTNQPPPPDSPLGTIEGMWEKGRKGGTDRNWGEIYLKAQEYLNDSFYGLRRMQTNIAKTTPIKPGGPDDIITLLTRSPGAANAGLTRALLHLDTLKQLAPNTNADDIKTILYANHAKEVLTQKGSERVMAGGFTTQAELDDALAQLQAKIGAARYQEAEAGAEYIKNVYAGELSSMVQEGLVSQELATELQQKYPWYNPLQYLDDAEELGMQGKSVKPFNVVSSGIKRLSEKGTAKEAVSPLTVFIDQLIKNEVKIVKNQTARAIVNVAQKDPSLGVVKVSTIHPVAQVEGKPVYRPTYQDPPGTLSFFEGGKRQIYKVPDFIYREANVLTQITNSPAASVVGAMNGISRAAFTSASPSFVVANVLNDMLPAFVSRGILPTQTAARIASEIRGLENDKIMQAFRLSGGFQARFFGRSAAQVAKEAGVDQGTVITKGKPIGKKILGFFPSLGEGGEQAPRTALFKRMLNETLPDWRNMDVETIASTPEAKKAAADAVELTINFARGGYFIKSANPFILFLNAAMEGTKLPFRALRTNPAARWRLASVVIGAIGLAAYNLSHPEYMDIPNYKRWSSLLVMLPPNKKNPDGTWQPRYLTIVPNTREWAMVLGSTSYAAEKMYADDPASFGTFSKTIVPQLSPINQVPAPALIAELMEQQANWDFYTARPIVSQSLQNLPATEQTTPNVSRTVEAVAQAAGQSPVRAQHLVSGILGGAAAAVTSTTDWIANLLSPDVPSPDILALAEQVKGLPTEKKTKDTITQEDFLRRINAADKRAVTNYLNKRDGGIPVISSIIRRILPPYGGQLESNRYDLERSVKDMPAYLTKDMTPDQMKAADVKLWTDKKAADAKIIDRYDLANINKSTTERDSYLKKNPDVEATLALWGTRSTLNSIEAAQKLESEAKKFGIPLDKVPAFALTDKGKERIPTDKALWQAYFDYNDLPGSGGYLSYSKQQVEAGELPEKFRVQWETYQKLTNDKVKTAYRKGHREASTDWREDLRRKNPAFDKWLQSEKDMKPLPPKTSASIRRSGGSQKVRLASASGLSGGSIGPRSASAKYPTFKRLRVATSMKVRAPRV